MNNNTTLTVDGWEHRVALGSAGFSRGVHYWEFTIDKYMADTDPAFGIARIDVARDKMLGKCFESSSILLPATLPLRCCCCAYATNNWLCFVIILSSPRRGVFYASDSSLVRTPRRAALAAHITLPKIHFINE